MHPVEDPETTFAYYNNASDGTKYKIINNIFNERTLCDIFEPRAIDLKITIDKLLWWASCTIR